jgi:hypothetical protein
MSELEKQVDNFRASIRAGGLRATEVKPLEQWFLHLPAVHRYRHAFVAHNDIAALRGQYRKTSTKPIISHAQGAQIRYLLENEEEMTHKGMQQAAQQYALTVTQVQAIDTLIMDAIRFHDQPEEFFDLQKKLLADVEEPSAALLKKLREEEVNIFAVNYNTRLVDAVLKHTSAKSLEKIFDGIDVLVVMPEVIDLLTPGKETGSRLSKSYIDTLRRIFRGSTDAAYISAIVKCYDRGNNTENMIADVSSVKRHTNLSTLQKQFSELEGIMNSELSEFRKNQLFTAKKKEFERVNNNDQLKIQQQYTTLQKQGRRERFSSLDPHDRIMELYKDFLLANEAIRFLERTEGTEATNAQYMLRDRLFQGVKYLLRTVSKHAQQQALLLTTQYDLDITGNCKRRGWVWDATNPINLYYEVNAAAANYVVSERARTIQTNQNEEQSASIDNIFDKTIDRLTKIERKKLDALKAYKTNYCQQLQDALLWHNFANTILEGIAVYEKSPATMRSFSDLVYITDNIANKLAVSQGDI